MSTDATLKAYFAEASSWDADRSAQQRRAARWSQWFALAGWSCAITSGVALMALTPLKRVDPFVVRVDNSTGVVDVVPVYAGQGALPEAITRYFLTHYVTICERFDYATAESDYEECGAFHNAARNQQWYAKWNQSNPSSPLNVYKDGTSLRAGVSAVSFFERASGVSDLAQVRYVRAVRPAGGTEEQVTHWIATVQYAYGPPSSDPKVRRWNPLGFKILEFRAEPEVLSTPEATGTATASVAATNGGRP
jgi:type IV secretion system protein VirB8